MKRLIDSFIVMMIIYAIMFLASSFFGWLEIFDPISDALKDTEGHDVVFSRMRDEPLADENIVLVNIGNLNREGIAEEINILSKYNPKVIGLDVFFTKNLRNPSSDSILMKAIKDAGNVVLVSKLLDFNHAQEYWDTVTTSLPLFSHVASGTGFANFTTLAKTEEDYKVVRTFLSTAEYIKNGTREVPFSVKLASYFDSLATEDFLARDEVHEVINYRGNAIGGVNMYANRFPALDIQQVFEEDFVGEFIKDKVVIMGFMGNNFYDKSTFDKFYTPLNPIYSGKAWPDMYGVVVHANIVGMILNRDYINTMNGSLEIILGVLICFLNVFLFSWIHLHLPRWYDGLTKLIQIFQAFVLYSITIYIFAATGFKMKLNMGIIALLLASDVLEIYYGVVRNSLTSERRDEIKKELSDIKFIKRN